MFCLNNLPLSLLIEEVEAKFAYVVSEDEADLT